MVQIVDIPVVKQGADLDGSDQIEGQAAAGGSGSSFRTSLADLAERIGEDISIPMSSVEGLVEDQERQDDALDDHETAAVATFAFAAYGGMRTSTPTAFPDIEDAWQTINVFDALAVSVPRGMSFNTGTGEFIIDNEGVYAVSLSGSFLHNTQNGERFTYLRFFDVTAGAPFATEYLTSSGRDDGASPISIFGIFEIDAASAGDTFRIEIGNGDDFTDVTFQTLNLTLFNVGEWREALP